MKPCLKSRSMDMVMIVFLSIDAQVVSMLKCYVLCNIQAQHAHLGGDLLKLMDTKYGTAVHSNQYASRCYYQCLIGQTEIRS